MIRSYLKTALRNLFRNKVYSSINIIGLSLGLACAMLIILYVKDEVSYDRFHTRLPRIYHVVVQDVSEDGKAGGRDGNTGWLQGPMFAGHIPEIVSFMRLQSGRGDMQLGDEVQSQDFLFADSNFFSFFTFPLLNGNPATALKNPHSIVLSEDEAMRQFGSVDVLGKTVSFIENEKKVPYVVTAVARRCPQNSTVKFKMLRPIEEPDNLKHDEEGWFNFFLNTFVMLSPGADLNRVQSKMQQVYNEDAAVAQKLIREKYGVTSTSLYQLQAFADMHLSKDLPPNNGLSDASNPKYSYILSAIVFFILLIACINFVNLTVARSIKRSREIGIRKVVGGERRQLIMQFLGESFLLCAIAFCLALALVQFLLPVFNRLSNKALSISYLIDARLLLGYVGLFLITGLLAGFYPALVLSKFNPVQTLYRRFNLAGKNYLQRGLVVLQFSLASFLIIATLIIFNQFNFLIHQKLGYDDANVIRVQKGSLSRSEAAKFSEALLKNPNILSTAAKNGGGWGTVAMVNGDTKIQFAYETVDPNFLPLMKIPLVKGRNFSPDFPSDSSSSVLVNEAFVKEAGWKDPLNQVVDFWYRNRKYAVIGVVKDYHFQSLSQKISPQLFTMNPENPYGNLYIKIQPGTETASLKYLEKTFRSLFPISPFSYEFQDDINRRQYESEAKWKQILFFASLLTIFISCIGLFGLSVLAAEKRTKEIGVRKVLGASVPGIVGILSRDFLKLVVLAMIIAIPAAWLAAGQWLENYPYRITLHWWMFASGALLVVLVAAFTINFQSVRAAMANPVRSLRSE